MLLYELHDRIAVDRPEKGKKDTMFTKGIAAVVATIIFATGVGWAQNFGASPAERYFRLEWEVGQARDGRPTVSGQIYNSYGLWAGDVQVLVEALDASGRPVSRTIGYGGEVPPNGRSYFWVPLPAAGATYRVTVQHFLWRGGGA